jgi:hypothetical protein
MRGELPRWLVLGLWGLMALGLLVWSMNLRP